jgi:8-amino-7-oxononanoate synthase
MNSFLHLQRQLDELEAQSRLRRLLPRTSDGADLIEPGGRRMWNFGGNDYLGLAASRLRLPAGFGSGASPLVCGWTDSHQQLADRIAGFESTEAAVLFPSGYAACSGTIATLAQRGDWILSDQLNHASLIDGCRLSAASCLVYPHRDIDALRTALRRQRHQFQQVWIVTDGVFSMDGHLAPLRSLCEIAERYDACLIVDEAHGTGVLGEGGRGACEALGVKDRVPIRIGTLSKAVGSQGGFVAAPRVVVDYLINRCRPLIFSTSLHGSAVLAARAGIEAIETQPERRERVQQLARRVRSGLSIATDLPEVAVPIVPVILGEDHRAVAASGRLAERGFFVPAIRPPTVPENSARLRISLSFAHDDAVVDSLVEAIAEQLRDA